MPAARLRPQFSLRLLLALVTLCALCALPAWRVWQDLRRSWFTGRQDTRQAVQRGVEWLRKHQAASADDASAAQTQESDLPAPP